MAVGRCSGHCCRRFPVSDTTPEYWADPARHGTALDGVYIADMLIHLGNEGGRDYYTCRHHDRETGNCLAYESRPAMCRDYPYNQPCEHAECTEPSKPDVPMSRFNVKSMNIR